MLFPIINATGAPFPSNFALPEACTWNQVVDLCRRFEGWVGFGVITCPYPGPAARAFADANRESALAYEAPPDRLHDREIDPDSALAQVHGRPSATIDHAKSDPAVLHALGLEIDPCNATADEALALLGGGADPTLRGARGSLTFVDEATELPDIDDVKIVAAPAGPPALGKSWATREAERLAGVPVKQATTVSVGVDSNCPRPGRKLEET